MKKLGTGVILLAMGFVALLFWAMSKPTAAAQANKKGAGGGAGPKVLPPPISVDAERLARYKAREATVNDYQNLGLPFIAEILMSYMTVNAPMYGSNLPGGDGYADTNQAIAATTALQSYNGPPVPGIAAGKLYDTPALDGYDNKIPYIGAILDKVGRPGVFLVGNMANGWGETWHG